MTTLKIGDKAPDFKALDQEGNEIQLSDFKGKKLVLFFYPKASTPGCTMEVKNLRDNYTEFLDKGYEILGVSADSAKRQQNFINKNELPFSLLADEDKSVIKAFGVWGLKKFMGREYMGVVRTTYIISPDGDIVAAWDKVRVKGHVESVKEKLKELTS